MIGLGQAMIDGMAGVSVFRGTSSEDLAPLLGQLDVCRCGMSVTQSREVSAIIGENMWIR